VQSDILDPHQVRRLVIGYHFLRIQTS
jgi:hypothetical protein